MLYRYQICSCSSTSYIIACVTYIYVSDFGISQRNACCSMYSNFLPDSSPILYALCILEPVHPAVNAQGKHSIEK